MKQELPLVADRVASFARSHSSTSWSDTFCTDPWTQLFVQRSGQVRVCCYLKSVLRDSAGKPLSVYQHSLDDIWNSEMLRNLRSDLANGRATGLCRECQAHEQAGFPSLRQQENAAWEQGWLNEEGLPLTALRARGADSGYHLAEPPISLRLNLGNECNLKCRMCWGEYSSRIEHDPVHSRWNGGGADDEKLPDGKVWYRANNFIKEQLLRNRHQIKLLNLIGGESLLIKQARDILQDLIDAGLAERIILSTTTNGTILDSPWLDLAQQFKHFYLGVSIDGFGKLYEYIRFPARWETIAGNLPILKKLPKTHIYASVTVQNYNALNIVELFRFLDSVEVGFYIIPLFNWLYLRPTCMPLRARQVAAARLQSYAAADCRPQQRAAVLGLAEMLTIDGNDAFGDTLAREFMLFTNDLDFSRGQCFRETCGELYEFIAESGFVWTDETRYADAPVH